MAAVARKGAPARQGRPKIGTVPVYRRRALLIALAGLACAPKVYGQARGQITRIVVPFAAGGAREILARTFRGELAAALEQTIIVENRPGAGGAIGTASVAKAPPDGHTLLFAASSHNATALLSSTPAYDPIKDFAPVANIGMQSYVLMTSAQLPARTVSELINEAKANPGKLNYASPGPGSSGHLAMAYLARLAGVEMVHIPFKSTQDATNDVIAGRSHALIVPNVGALPFAHDERIRLLGVTSPKRSLFLPQVPAIAETLPGYAFESWFGLLAPAGTPQPIIEHINAAVSGLLKEKVILERLSRQGVEPRPLTPEAFGQLIRDDYEAMAKIVKLVGRVQ
jgi:tripartite-type tricarboxylate transporter receptor subunit TctC